VGDRAIRVSGAFLARVVRKKACERYLTKLFWYGIKKARKGVKKNQNEARCSVPKTLKKEHQMAREVV
jgi:hypothetical protein